MCHWILRVWKCGDSFFTKYSSCSFDRAAHDPNNLLNPLHPSIELVGVDRGTQAGPEVNRSGARGPKGSNKSGNRSTSKCRFNCMSKPHTTSGARNGEPTLTHPMLATVDTSTPGAAYATGVSNDSKTVFPRDAKTGEMIPIPLSEIGKCSRFGDVTLGEETKCNVFEVVLQSNETTVCPACARSPKRARLPAHARGCFGLS